VYPQQVPWRSVIPNLCSDEMLIRLLEGELRFDQRWLARRHVRRCWVCRARQEELEASLRLLVGLERDHSAQTRGLASFAERQFQAWRHDYEQSIGTLPNRRKKPVKLLLATAFAVCLAAVLAVVRFPGKNTGGNNLEQTIARARQAEMTLLNSDGIIRQEFSVEITEVKPVKRKRQSRLDVWSDGDRRYFAQWAGSKGEIKFAAWQPAADAGLYSNRQVPTEFFPRSPERRQPTFIFPIISM
jgi:hypothetical protein